MMTTDTIITTTCGMCGGQGRREMKQIHSPGRKQPKQYYPCDACGTTGTITRSIVDRCFARLKGSSPEFCARRDAPLMAQAAIDFAGRNMWCSIAESISIEFQDPAFHQPDIRRSRRNKLRAECAVNGAWRARLTDRRMLMHRIAKTRGFAHLGDFAASQYRRGKVSPTLYHLMDSSDLTRMQINLGFYSMSGGRLVPTLTGA